MIDTSTHLINQNQTATDALAQMEGLGQNLTLFVIDDDGILRGTLTDGDIRRGLLRKLNLHDAVGQFMQTDYKFLRKGSISVDEVASLRGRGLRLIPVVSSDSRIIKIINLEETITILPIDVVVMAGGEGRRLRPLTENVPKPLLRVGDRPIIDHNLRRLTRFGVDNFWICVRYLGHQIINYFGSGSTNGISIGYIKEREPLGTIGAVKLIEKFEHETVLVTNSDLLTDLDYEDFYNDFIKSEADLSIVTIPYRVGVPYAVLETSDGRVLSFKEKPTYTFYSNGGIYLMNREVVDQIPENTIYDATDLIENLIALGKKVVSYPHSGYWLDIGRLEDFEKAKIDIGHLKL